MKPVTKEALLTEIDRIIKVIDGATGDRFVCVVANSGRTGDAVRSMVRRHIGRNGTMNSFLSMERVKGCYTSRVANAYRILMLENMKKMVQKEYK